MTTHALTRTLFMKAITSVAEVVKVVDIFRFYTSHFVSVSHSKFNVRELLVLLDQLIHDLTVIRDDIQITRDAIAKMSPGSATPQALEDPEPAQVLDHKPAF